MLSVPCAIGIDIGGTKSAVALYETGSWKLIKREKFPTHAQRGFPAVLEDTLRLSEEWMTDGVVAIGLGIPGLVKQPEGVIQTLPNIPGGEGYKLLDMCSERFDLPVTVENDSNCFALAEARKGAGKGDDVVIGITMGTGVGGGIVIDGKIFRGSQGFAAEIGHMLLVPGSPPFETNNKRGEVEQFLSGSALRKRCPEAADPNEFLEGTSCASIHPAIIRECAWLCTNLTHLLNPSSIIFGGSMGKALQAFLPSIEEEMRQWVLTGTPLPRLALSQIAGASTMGAAMLAWDASQK